MRVRVGLARDRGLFGRGRESPRNAAHLFLHPWPEFVERLPAQSVAVSRDADVAVGADFEAAVGVSPTVAPEGLLIGPTTDLVGQNQGTFHAGSVQQVHQRRAT